MLKPYPHFQTRVVECLSGLWEFAFLADAKLDELDLSAVRYADKLVVPQAFDATPRYAGRRGTAVYRTTFATRPGRAARLHFEAVSMWCRVYVDGRPLREHACGWSPFWVDVPPSANAQRELVVVADNRFDFARAPLHEEFFDFYHWGGITRNVWLHHVPATYLERVAVVTDDWQTGKVSVTVKLGGQAPAKAELGCGFDGAAPVVHDALNVFDGHVRLQLRVPDPRPWSPEAPNLHTLRVTCGEDDMVVRFGLRDFNTDGPRLVLNDQPLKLKGYNRHESHPHFGPATPDALLLTDIQHLKALGCNAVRGSHYPQDQRFLDLCDELGLLVWEETLGWGQREKPLTDPTFITHHRQMVEEMVHASINHPSVVMWGFLNEFGSDGEYARPIVEQTVQQLRELDPSRLITYASMYAEKDIFFPLVDVISLNIYPGWYGCNDHPRPLDLIQPRMRELAEHFATAHPAKPVIISEIGAEALYGWHDPMDGFFTEEYQAGYISRAVDEALANPRLQGILLWHFADARTYAGGRSLGRPRAYNNKGTLDEYRRPKAAYKAVRERYHR